MCSSLVIALLFGLGRADAQFIPGSGGSVPDIAPFTDPVGSIGGLRVYQTHRRNYTFGSGNHPELDLDFLPPSDFGATAYVLQRSLNGTTGWADVPWGMEVLRTTANNSTNFSFTPDGHYFSGSGSKEAPATARSRTWSSRKPPPWRPASPAGASTAACFSPE